MIESTKRLRYRPIESNIEYVRFQCSMIRYTLCTHPYSYTHSHIYRWLNNFNDRTKVDMNHHLSWKWNVQISADTLDWRIENENYAVPVAVSVISSSSPCIRILNRAFLFLCQVDLYKFVLSYHFIYWQECNSSFKVLCETKLKMLSFISNSKFSRSLVMTFQPQNIFKSKNHNFAYKCKNLIVYKLWLYKNLILIY